MNQIGGFWVRVAVLLLCIWPSSPAGVRAEQGSLGRTLVGSPAPAFTRRTLEGGTLALPSLRGDVVLLNFWASWCAPCLAEMPVFAQWSRAESPRGLRVVGVSMDDAAGPAAQVAHRLRLAYPLLLGDAALAQSYGGVLGLPVTFLIDRAGVVRQRIEGAADLEAMHRAAERLLR